MPENTWQTRVADTGTVPRHGDGSTVFQLFAFFGTKEELNVENQRFLSQLFVKPCYTHVTPMSHPCHPCQQMSANCLSMSLAFQCETCIMGIVEGQKERGPEKRNRVTRIADPGERNLEKRNADPGEQNRERRNAGPGEQNRERRNAGPGEQNRERRNAGPGERNRETVKP